MSHKKEVKELKKRFKEFIEKLTVKAEELEEETLAIVQQVYDEDEDPDKISFLHFKSGIKGQFTGLFDKVDEVYKTKILAKRKEIFNLEDELGDDWDECEEMIDKMSEWHDKFENKIDKKSKKIFKSVSQETASSKLEAALKEYQDVKKTFCCSQCGSPLVMEHMYFIATYIECNSCQTQNTFTPDYNIGMIPVYVEDAAEEKHKDLKKNAYKHYNNGYIKMKSYKAFYEYRAFIFLEHFKYMPLMKHENALGVYSYMNIINNFLKKEDFYMLPNMYEKVLEILDFKETPKEVTKEQKNTLIELSIVFLEKLGHFDKFQNEYNSKLEELKELIN